jgi:hypothetical protein
MASNCSVMVSFMLLYLWTKEVIVYYRDLEFPGCGDHKTLLTHINNNLGGECYKCSTSTDSSMPWCVACRNCEAAQASTLIVYIHEEEAMYLANAYTFQDSKIKGVVYMCTGCYVR